MRRRKKSNNSSNSTLWQQRKEYKEFFKVLKAKEYINLCGGLSKEEVTRKMKFFVAQALVSSEEFMDCIDFEVKTEMGMTGPRVSVEGEICIVNRKDLLNKNYITYKLE